MAEEGKIAEIERRARHILESAEKQGLWLEDLSSAIDLDPRSAIDTAAYITASDAMMFNTDRIDFVAEVDSPQYHRFRSIMFLASSAMQDAATDFVRRKYGKDAAFELESFLEDYLVI